MRDNWHRRYLNYSLMLSKHQLIRNRGGLILKGVATSVFGLVALAHPGEGIHQMMLPFGMLVILNGIISICQCFSLFGPRMSARKVVLVKGIIESFIGLSTIVFLNAGSVFFLVLISLWLILTGLVQIARSKALKPVSDRYQMIRLSGWIEFVSGVLLLINIKTQWFDPMYELSILAILMGGIMIYTYFRIRALQDYLDHRPKKLTEYQNTVYYDRTY